MSETFPTTRLPTTPEKPCTLPPKRPANPAMEHSGPAREPHSPALIDLLEAPERVVRDMEPGRPCPQEFTHQVEKFEHIGRRRPYRLVHHPGNPGFDWVRLHRPPGPTAARWIALWSVRLVTSSAKATPAVENKRA